MKPTYRDVLDPSDPYWPRVRRLHTYFWANGVLAQKKLSLVMDSFLWLCVSIFGTLLSLLWRSALLVGGLFIVDWKIPGVVSCITRDAVGYVVPYFALPDCTMIDLQYLPSLSAVGLIVVVVFLIYPIRRFLQKVFEMIFMSLSIITLGYPLKFVAYVATLDPNLAGKWMDKSYTFGPLSTAMELPTDHQMKKDRLWQVYRGSQSPVKESELEKLLEEYEARYFG